MCVCVHVCLGECMGCRKEEGKGKKEGKQHPLSKRFLLFYYHILFLFFW